MVKKEDAVKEDYKARIIKPASPDIKPASTSNKPAPARSKTASTSNKPAPVRSKTASTTNKPAPARKKTASTTNKPAPARRKTASANNKPVSPDTEITNNKQKENKAKMKKTEETTNQNEDAVTANNTEVRSSEANGIVKNRMIASVGAGLIPFPVVDVVALTAIQLDTVRALSKIYDVKFIKDAGKTAITSLTGGIFPVAAAPWLGSVVKTVPVVGQLMGAISMPVLAGASTYAVGKVFIQHFESGGTFLTFDPEKVKDYFQEEFEKGKEFAKTETKAS